MPRAGSARGSDGDSGSRRHARRRGRVRRGRGARGWGIAREVAAAATTLSRRVSPETAAAERVTHSMDAQRWRERQGAFVVHDGTPEPDPETTLAIIAGAIAGRWLARHSDRVRGQLLDLGCGNQPYGPWYRPLVGSFVTLDAVPLPGVDVVAMADQLPFDSGTFDTVLATEVLEHVTDAERAAAEIARVLRVDGHALVTVPYLYPTHEEPYDFRRFTHYGLARLLERHGLDVLSLDAKGGPGTLLLHYMTLAARQGVSALGGRLGKPDALRRPTLRAAITRPQQLLARRLHTEAGVSGLAARMSLGYMAVARKGG
jgi:SAM-dependent methyltransferase